MKTVIALLESILLVGILSSCRAPVTQRATQSALTPDTWRQLMRQVPLPKNGCFEGTYPGMDWQEVTCTTPPTYPQSPAQDSRNHSVGNGNSFTAQVAGTISSVTGSFESASITGETGNKFSTDCSSSVPEVRDTFALQINTNVFDTAAEGCNQRSGCKGWQQFVYSNAGKAYIQNWLISNGAACPQGWIAFQDDCFKNSVATSVPTQTMVNLAQLSLSGTVNGSMNSVFLSIASSDNSAMDKIFAVRQDNVLNLAQGWNNAEFNVFGDGCSSQANFNAGTALAVRVSIASTPASTPSCLRTGFTEETNNLDLKGCSSFGEEGAPAGILFTEGN